MTLTTLDLALDKENGLDLPQGIQTIWNVPIIMLTGCGDAIDRVLGLELGAEVPSRLSFASCWVGFAPYSGGGLIA